MRVIISGGGSGGHVFPAIAIANALRDENLQNEILFVGAKGKMEMESVPKAGYQIKGLEIAGLHRKKVWKNITFPPKLLKSLYTSRSIIKEFKPDVVVGVGGFASGPLLYMATTMGIPSLIQEQNSYPGITNKLLARKVKRICVAYPGMDKYFDADKIVFTGNPVRQDIYDNKILAKDAKAFYGLDESYKTVLIFGGSLGARTLNNAILNNIEILKKEETTNFIWQVGRLYYDEFKSCEAAGLSNVKLLPFIDRMDMAYAAADIIVCRAGALTISELALVAKPSILVPSPNVAEDHQTKNAQALVKADAAELVKDEDAQTVLGAEMIKLLRDEERQMSLRKGIGSFAKPDATKMIVKQIMSLVAV